MWQSARDPKTQVSLNRGLFLIRVLTTACGALGPFGCKRTFSDCAETYTCHANRNVGGSAGSSSSAAGTPSEFVGPPSFGGSGSTGGGGSTGGSAGVPAVLCAANAATCEGNRATTCNATGTGYLVGGTECSTDQTCFQGACENHKCTPSSVFCQAQELKTCAANGLSSTSQTCEVNATCTANAGSFACLCKPGYSGTGLTCAVTTCAINQHVQANACVACGVGTTNAAGDDASGPNTNCNVPPSCQDLLANCGVNSDEDCCTSLTVTGGTFNRSNDANYPATVSSFRLDKFEVTVGRFRKFVNAVVSNWTPAPGSGKHTHLASGGLANSIGGGIEAGWDPSWSTNLPTAKLTWDGSSYLGCDATRQTWTATSGQNEPKPINCVNWYQASAFCLWDGGFLPSEAERSYAAVGGNLQRQYPWSDPPGATQINCSYANYWGASGNNTLCVQAGTSVVGSVATNGTSLYGQVDLAGNVSEWNLDWYGTYAASCSNCANAALAPTRVVAGGAFFDFSSKLLSSYRDNKAPAYRDRDVGLRCARTP